MSFLETGALFEVPVDQTLCIKQNLMLYIEGEFNQLLVLSFGQKTHAASMKQVHTFHSEVVFLEQHFQVN